MTGYEKAMSATFAKTRKKLLATGKFDEMVSMIYDRDGMTPASLRKANRELAKHNMVFRRFSGRGFWKHRGCVVQKDLNKPVPSRPYWLSVADKIVFENGGGCQ